MNPSPEEWGMLLDAVDGVATVGVVANVLADARGFSDSRAYEIVTDAVDTGPLKETDTGASFPEVRLRDEFNQQDTPEDGSVLVKDEPDVPGAAGPEKSPAEGESGDETPTPEAPETGSSRSKYTDIDFSRTESDTYPPALLEREQWMGRKGKLPFAPWGDKNPEDAAPDDSPRWEWGRTENHVDGETVAIAEDDPQLDGRVFIQRESDGFAFVDGDDVRDPETGEAHPAFLALLERLGTTYADVSTSGSGVHAYYTGEIPVDGQGQAVFEIDTEPWGANDDAPSVEIYANKHVCVTTGEHVDGTPLEVAPWDTEELEEILDEYDARKETVSHDTDRDRAELEGYDPTATKNAETTSEIKDVLKAVDRLTPQDLRLRTSKVGSDSTGWEKWDPSSYRSSSGNDSLHRPAGESVFHDHKHGEAFGVLSLFAAEEGIISKPWDRLAGSDWWDAVKTAREYGAPIPEYEHTGGESEQVAVLPSIVRDLSTAASGWDWRHAAHKDDRDLSIDDARERTVGAISDAYKHGDRVLIEALPTMGKSYGAVKAAAETDTPTTILTGRGRKEQYDQLREWCDEFGLTHKTLPSFTHDCPTANGEHGEEWRDTVLGWYNRGATPQEIHKAAEYVLGRPLPCQEHDGQRCPYASKWDFDPETDGSLDPEEDVPIDVLIGHYSHAYREEKVTTGRAVVFDEFPDAYETGLGADLRGAVSYWLACTDGVPFEDYTDLLENRADESRRADALLWFEEHGVEPDESHVFDDENAHAHAPLAAFTILAGDDLGNGFEKADIPEVGTGVRNRENGGVAILRPPELDYARSVVALDGTPTKEMWDLALGERLNHRQVLQDGERAEYIRDALNLNLVRTTDAVKPYNSAEHVNTEQDAALLEEIVDTHGERPSVITTSTAVGEYETEGVLEHVDGTKHYGNVLGSNEFKEKRLGAVIGSSHYGDDYLKKWGAYAGESVERNDEKGSGLSYGHFGDKVLTHMREHETLQAAMRFGRDGNGAVVYVHTDTLPEWVPLAGEGRVVSTWSDGMKDVLRALEDLESASTAEITAHDAVTIGHRQVFDHLETLRERDVLTREQDTEDARRVVWNDDGVHRLNDHGAAELDPVDLDDLDEEEVAELARSSNYTWEFRNSGRSEGAGTGERQEPGMSTTTEATNRGDRPPTDAD